MSISPALTEPRSRASASSRKAQLGYGSDVSDDEQMVQGTTLSTQGFPEFQGRFIVQKKIGQGTCSVVYRAVRASDNLVVAIKAIKRSNSARRIENEMKCLKLLGGQHHVATLIEKEGLIRNKGHSSIVLEYLEHQNFKRYYRKMTTTHIYFYFRALLEALAHLHRHGICHRDVKPSNFLHSFDKLERLIRNAAVDSDGYLVKPEELDTHGCFSLVDYGLSQYMQSFDEHRKELRGKKRSSAAGVTKSVSSSSSSSSSSKSFERKRRTTFSSARSSSSKSSSMVSRNRKKNNAILPLESPQLSPPLLPGTQSFTNALKRRRSEITPPVKPLVTSKSPYSPLGTDESVVRKKARRTEPSKPIPVAARGGTRGFRAMEVLMRSRQQTPLIDLFSVGSILLSIMSRRNPVFLSPDDTTAACELLALLGHEHKDKTTGYHAMFTRGARLTKEEGKMSVVRKVIQSGYEIKHDGQTVPWCEELYDLLFRLLEPEPMKRISAAEALHHPFFKLPVPALTQLP